MNLVGYEGWEEIVSEMVPPVVFRKIALEF